MSGEDQVQDRDPTLSLDSAAFRGILDALQEGVYVTADDRCILYWNPAAESLTGYKAHEVVGSHCWDNILAHVDEHGTALCPSLCPLAHTLADGRPREALVYLHHKLGHRVPVTVRVNRYLDPATGRYIGVESFVPDAERRAMRKKLAEMAEMAYLDPLTQLANRNLVEKTIDSRLADLRRHGWPLGVLFVDIDHFKHINDLAGHAAGDAVLQMVARSLDNASRGSDLVGRWGGEEFVVVAPNTDPKGLELLAERLRTIIAASRLVYDDFPLSVTVSIGATTAAAEDDLLSLVARADDAMYESKRKGRNRCTVVGSGAPATPPWQPESPPAGERPRTGRR